MWAASLKRGHNICIYKYISKHIHIISLLRTPERGAPNFYTLHSKFPRHVPRSVHLMRSNGIWGNIPKPYIIPVCLHMALYIQPSYTQFGQTVNPKPNPAGITVSPVWSTKGSGPLTDSGTSCDHLGICPLVVYLVFLLGTYRDCTR